MPPGNPISNPLYVTDLDHTLLQQDARLSAGARSRLTRLLRNGLPLTVASARSIVSIREILGGLPLTLPVIHYDGGMVSDWLAGDEHAGVAPRERHLFIESLDPALAASLLDEIARRGLHPMVSTHDGNATWIWHGGAANGGMAWYLDERRVANDDRIRQTAQPTDALSAPVVSMTMIDTADRLAPLEAWLAGSLDGRVQRHFYLNQYNRPWHWLSIHPARATKAAALERLLPALGRRPGDLVVFGDGDNDIPMFRLAGRAVAVANATDRLKAEADEIIGPNTADSVVEYLERDWTDDHG